MLEGAAEAVELGDDEFVVDALGDEQRLVELWTAGKLAAGVVDEDLIAVGGGEGRRADCLDSDRV